MFELFAWTDEKKRKKKKKKTKKKTLKVS